MFDDQKQAAGAPQPPANLPIGEPDDMFASTDPSAAQPRTDAPTAGIPPAEPVPPAVLPPPSPSAIGAGMLKPKSVTEAPPAPATSGQPVMSEPDLHVPPPSMPGMNKIKEPGSAKTIMTIVVVVVSLVVLGGGGWLIYNSFVKVGDSPSGFVPPTSLPDTATNPVEPLETTNILDDQEGSFGDEELDITTDAIDDSLLFGEAMDSDADNLDNSREETLGTDSNNWDSDGDGLGDGDEVIIWKTDPLNPDTDGDGFLDGDEVKNGYSPTGEGKIFEPPSES